MFCQYLNTPVERLTRLLSDTWTKREALFVLSCLLACHGGEEEEETSGPSSRLREATALQVGAREAQRGSGRGKEA